MKTRILGFVAATAVAGMTVIALFVVPADLNQGDAQRIMYPHVASAWLGYLSFGVTALAGILWLWKRDLRFDAVAQVKLLTFLQQQFGSTLYGLRRN